MNLLTVQRIGWVPRVLCGRCWRFVFLRVEIIHINGLVQQNNHYDDQAYDESKWRTCFDEKIKEKKEWRHDWKKIRLFPWSPPIVRILVYWLTRQDVADRIIVFGFVVAMIVFAATIPVPQVTYDRQQSQTVLSLILSSEIPLKINEYFFSILKH